MYISADRAKKRRLCRNMGFTGVSKDKAIETQMEITGVDKLPEFDNLPEIIAAGVDINDAVFSD